MYLVAVLDWYSRYIVSWELDQTLHLPFALDAATRALQLAKPTIWNSDQGSHFTSAAYVNLLRTHGVQISMDGRGRVLDNIFTERLWRTIKYEEVYLKEYESSRHARQELAFRPRRNLAMLARLALSATRDGAFTFQRCKSV